MNLRVISIVIGLAVAVLVGQVVRSQFENKTTGFLVGVATSLVVGGLIGLVVWKLAWN